MVFRRLALVALFGVLALPAFAHDYRLGAIEIGQPWARATPPTAESGGGFLVLKNTGTTPDRLIAVKSPAADKVEIHEMKMDGNIMRMREVEKGIEIPLSRHVHGAEGAVRQGRQGAAHPGVRESRQHRRRIDGPGDGRGRAHA
jgi:copper(I)-binding protein